MTPADKSPLPSVGQDNSTAGSVPVFNCHARLSMPDAEGWISARCCNLPEIVVRGKTQREALAALVAAFKAAVSEYRAAGVAIPWSDAPVRAEPGEQERWIAVHL
jgi:predicted RNase H-like HicB family nuclease